MIGTRCDVFAPCAVARVIDPESVGRLHCSIVAGAANDTLSHRADAELLAARDITYVPDFVANAGGVVDIHGLRMGWDEHRMRQEVLKIGDRTEHVLAAADRQGQTPLLYAEEMAAERLAAARATPDDAAGGLMAVAAPRSPSPTGTRRTRARWCCPASRRWCG